MGGDHKFYYDFKSEIKLDNWDVVKLEDTRALLQCTLTMEEGNYIFLAPCLGDTEPSLPHLQNLAINDKNFPLDKVKAVYVHSSFARYGFEFRSTPGSNLFTAEVTLPLNGGKLNMEHLFFSLQKDEETVVPIPPAAVPDTGKKHIYPATNYCRNRDTFTPDKTWKKGVGHKNGPGRFGFSKGDGLLDCAMPTLGIVDKMFLCGQERYRKPYRWNYSLLPEGMELHGSYAPNDTGIEKDDIKVNPLSVCWAAQYKGKRFSCSYSLASPAILCESEHASMRLSNLRFAGNYQSVLIPREDGVEETTLDKADLNGMKENWILLFNSTEFPDCPLMLVFERPPEAMNVKRDPAGRLEAIELPGVKWMLSCTPFGIQRFDPGKMTVPDAIRRCRFWSRALLAYPVRCREYFRLDEKAQKVTIRQQFEYRYLEDSWGTEPLELAALPPPLSICGTSEYQDAADFEFPTKYGHLRGRIGCWSEYTLPFMPLERKFPLRDDRSRIPELLRKGMETYQNMTSAFGPDKVSYPYAGAILEPYAFTSTMSLFMDKSDREFLLQHLKESMAAALNPEALSDYTVINWGEMMRNPSHEEVMKVYRDPAKKHMTLHNWYDRVEPFTGVKFKICYLNVGFFSGGVIKTGTQEEILGLKIPLIENDWGVGLTFYYTYLCSLAAGSFDEVRKNWDLLKQVYAFFDLMHDWACMGTGYSDNGITWVEGANYGLFPAFIHMAEAVQDLEARDFGICNAAKQLALRLAVLRSSQEYFPQYFETEPWYCAKFFHEEGSPHDAFQNVPDLQEGRLRCDSVYNFTTEGLYPEAYTALRKFGGEFYTNVMDRLENCLIKGMDNSIRWTIMQQFAGLMTDRILGQCSAERCRELQEEALSKDLLMKEWRGIHIFSRVLPENYLRCQLLAWLEMRDHKLWLEHWMDVQIVSALWHPATQSAELEIVVTGKDPLIQCGIRDVSPSAVTLDEKALSWEKIREDKIVFRPGSSGKLVLAFPA